MIMAVLTNPMRISIGVRMKGAHTLPATTDMRTSPARGLSPPMTDRQPFPTI